MKTLKQFLKEDKAFYAIIKKADKEIIGITNDSDEKSDGKYDVVKMSADFADNYTPKDKKNFVVKNGLVHFKESVINESSYNGKISQEDYAELEKEMTAALKNSKFKSFQEIYNNYAENKIGRDPKVRARWDIFNAIPEKLRSPLLNKMYKYGVNDTHIDTALKSITEIK